MAAGRDRQEMMVDSPADLSAHDEYVDALQRRQHELGFTGGDGSPTITINRGKAYASAESDTYIADVVEDTLTHPAGVDIVVNRPRTDRKDEPAPVRSTTIYSDEHAAPGSEPIVHDPMTPEKRESTRAALERFAADRHFADGEGDGGSRVARVTPVGVPMPNTGDPVFFADRVAGVGAGVEPGRAPAVVLADSDSARLVERDEKAAEAAARSLVPADHTDDVTVDEFGRSVLDEDKRAERIAREEEYAKLNAPEAPRRRRRGADETPANAAAEANSPEKPKA